MKGLIFFIWFAFYVIGMWTESSTQLLRELKVSFQLVSEPSFAGFWSTSYAGVLVESELLLLLKIFHVLSSLLLGMLFFQWRGLRFFPVVILLFMVTFIEVMQIFFTREALALDVLLNTSGVLAAAALVWLWKNILEKKLERPASSGRGTIKEEMKRLQEK